MNTLTLDWAWFDEACQTLVDKITASKVKFENVYGIPRGGLFVATRLSYLLDLPLVQARQQVGPRTLCVDDIADSGHTLHDLYRFLSPHEPPQSATLLWTKWSNFLPTYSVLEKQEGMWAIFPWEVSAVSDTVSKVNP